MLFSQIRKTEATRILPEHMYSNVHYVKYRLPMLCALAHISFLRAEAGRVLRVGYEITDDGSLPVKPRCHVDPASPIQGETAVSSWRVIYVR